MKEDSNTKMKNKLFNIFKIEYNWCEGEHEETFLGKNVDEREFDKDLIKAKNFAKSLLGKNIETWDYLGKGYTIECLPKYYEQIIWFLVDKMKYIECYFNNDIFYRVGSDEMTKDKIELTKFNKKIKRINLK